MGRKESLCQLFSEVSKVVTARKGKTELLNIYFGSTLFNKKMCVLLRNCEEQEGRDKTEA